MSKFFRDIYGFYFTDQDLCIFRNVYSCKFCNCVCALSYDLRIQGTVDNDRFSYFFDLILL